MPARNVTLLLALCLPLITACSSGPPPLEVTGEATVVDDVEHVRVVVQTRKGEVVQIYPGFEEVTADATGKARFDIVPPEDALGGPTVHVTATIRVKGDPPILEKTIEVPRVPRLIHDEVLPRLTCAGGGCTLAVERDLKVRMSGSGLEITVGGVPMARDARTLPPLGVLASPGVDGELTGTGEGVRVPVRIVREGTTYEGDLRLNRTDVLDALRLALAEVSSGPVDLPGDGTGAAVAWLSEYGLDPVRFYGDVTKLGDIGRVALPGAEQSTGRTIDCGMYGNDQGDRQRKRLELMKLTVDVYDVRTGDKVLSKSFAPVGRCPETIRKGATLTRILPPEQVIYDWLETL